MGKYTLGCILSQSSLQTLVEIYQKRHLENSGKYTPKCIPLPPGRRTDVYFLEKCNLHVTLAIEDSGLDLPLRSYKTLYCSNFTNDANINFFVMKLKTNHEGWN